MEIDEPALHHAKALLTKLAEPGVEK